MNQISEKELSALNDLLSGEELLIKKFQVLADNCTDSEVKAKFTEISNGTRSISVPYIPSSANSQAKNKNEAHRMEGNMQQSFYSEKEMFADALTAEKSATTLYNTFSNECVHANVRNAILDCLEKEHNIQNEVFNMMHDRGYYPTPSAEMQKVDEAKQKFGQCMQSF